jgi:NAD(P)-dependent dehydrogenase (short-subunit alcohol dehydrogenase family)
MRTAVDRVVAEAGRIDVLVNNAGYVLTGAVEETSDAEIRALFETNVFGVARVIRASLPTMRERGGGRIINVGSILGVMPAPFLGFYSAGKHALEGLSESLDHEVRPFGIRVALIEPSYTRTELTRNSKTVAVDASEYAVVRQRASAAFAGNTAVGIDPALVADAILKAATVATPRLRYAVGRQARLLVTLRRFAPSRFFDRGVRRNFRLDAPATRRAPDRRAAKGDRLNFTAAG